jgi:hypothetical protein
MTISFFFFKQWVPTSVIGIHEGYMPNSSARNSDVYICTTQSLFGHSYVVNEWLNRHCDAQIDIWIRADELGNNILIYHFLSVIVIYDIIPLFRGGGGRRGADPPRPPLGPCMYVYSRCLLLHDFTSKGGWISGATIWVISQQFSRSFSTTTTSRTISWIKSAKTLA